MYKLRLVLVGILAVSCWAVPVADETVTAECNSVNCVEPACRCWNSGVPKGLTVDEVPQIVFLTFDESVTVSNYANYTAILGNRKNPNGCPISMTFFTTHDYTNYAHLNSLYKKGSEISLHSIRGGLTNTDYWKKADEKTWFDEMDGLRTIISTYGNVPKSEITGSRAPFVQPGGDVMINALKRAGVTYDASYHTRKWTGSNPATPALWPYTLDQPTGQDCQNPPCPTGKHPGFWMVPMVDLYYNETVFCSMVDQCGRLPTKNDQYKFLLENFNRHYTSNRAPFGIYAHSAWFQGAPHILDGYLQFLDEILSYGDVFVVSLQKGLAWMKNPTKLGSINNFGPWMCPAIVAPCRSLQCTYLDVEGGGDRIMTQCASACPNNYPWFENPTGM